MSFLVALALPLSAVPDDPYDKVDGWTIRKGDGRCYMFNGTNMSTVAIISQSLKDRAYTLEFLDAGWRFPEQPSKASQYVLTVSSAGRAASPWTGLTGVSSANKSGGGKIALQFTPEQSKRLHSQLIEAGQVTLSHSSTQYVDQRLANMAKAVERLDQCVSWFS